MGKLTNFIFIGRSGSAKGTQAKLLLEKFPNLYYIATGDLLRNLAKLKTDVGMRINQLLTSGGLPSHEIPIMLWMHEISLNLTTQQGFIADGFPRRLPEAKILTDFLKWMERWESTKILWIDITREEAHKRLKLRGRSDDVDENINNRQDWFEKDVMPIVEYYKSENKLIRINGEQTIEKVFEEILSHIQ